MECLTHGAAVDSLGLVFVLGAVPHERQPFQSCTSAAIETDRGRGGTDRQTETERERTDGGGRQRGQTGGVGRDR